MGIKNIFRGVLYFITGVILLLCLSYAVLRSPYVQTRLVKYFTDRIERTTGVRIQIGGVNFYPMSSLVLNDVYLEDNRKDTLLFCQDLTVRIDSFNLFKRSFVVRQVLLDRAYFNLWLKRGEEESVMNIEALIDSLGKMNGTKEPEVKQQTKAWLIGLDKISLRNSRFRYREDIHEELAYGINWTDIECRELNVDVSQMDFSDGNFGMLVSNLNFQEKSGFVIKELDARMLAKSGNLLVTEGKIELARSLLWLEKMEYNWTPDQRDWRNFITKMQQYYKLAPSYVSFLDLAYFNENLLGITNTLTCSGIVSNTVDKIEGRDLKIGIGKHSVIEGGFKSSGLPKIRETVFDIDFHNTRLFPEDLETVYLPWFGLYLKLPQFCYNLRYFDVEGKLKGRLDDFVLNGKNIDPNLLGAFDLKYTPAVADSLGGSEMSGKFDFRRINCRMISRLDFLGNGQFAGTYNGYVNDEDARLNLTGKFNSLSVNGAKLKDIDLFLALENDKLDVISSLENDSIRGNIVFSSDMDDSVTFTSAKGNLKIDNLGSFGLSYLDKNEALGFSFDLVHAENRDRNSFANLKISDFGYSNSNGSFILDNINIENSLNKGYYITTLNSGIADLYAEGRYGAARPVEFMYKLLQSYLPAYQQKKTKQLKKFRIDDVDFSWKLNVLDADRVLRVIYPDLSVSEGTRVFIDFLPEDEQVTFALSADSVRYKKISFIGSRMDIKGKQGRLDIVYGAERMRYKGDYSLYNVRDVMSLYKNQVDNKLTWSNWGRRTFSGSLAANMHFVPDKKGKYKTEINIKPGVIIMSDSLWRVKESAIIINGKEIEIKHFTIGRDKQYLLIDGKISENPEDQLMINLSRFNLAELNRIVFNNQLNAFGLASGNLIVQDYYKNNLLYSSVNVQNWGVNKDTLGSLELKSYWDFEQNRLNINASNRIGHFTPFRVKGYYNPTVDSLDVDIKLSEIGISRLETYAKEHVAKSSGGLSGEINISGPFRHPDLSGFISMDSLAVKIRAVNTDFFVNDSIIIDKNRLFFNDLEIKDVAGNRSLCSGYYQFWNNKYDVNIKSDNFLLLNTGYNDNEAFYGKVFMSGVTNINNGNGVINLTVNARTESNSKLYIPLSSGMSEQDNNFLHFVNSGMSTRRRNQAQYNRSDFDLNANLELNNNLEVQVVFDPTIGDILKSTGTGNLKVTLDKDGMLNMFGDYNITKGDYLFTLSNLLNKKFILQPGGTIMWNGSPYDATVNISAVYNLKTSLNELLPQVATGDEVKEQRSTKVPVECVLKLNDNFTNPSVKFDLSFPSLDTQTKSYVQSLFSSQDEINKQMFSLLILNKFYSPDYLNKERIDERSMGYQAGVTTATELLSSQLSRWFSQISNNLDVGLSYRPGDEITTNEIELALSTQLLNDRVMISANGNVDVGGSKSQTTNGNNSNIAGDFDVDVKLNRQGTLKLKAYSHTDEKITYNATETIQGVGVSYQESFDTFRELMRKYFGFLQKGRKEQDQ